MHTYVYICMHIYIIDLYMHNVGGVVPVLMSLLEPPPMDHVTKSLQHLYDMGLISSPDDNGDLTEMGQLAGQLPVDLMLGRFIFYGVMFSLTEEVVIMAASLSLPKSPFRIASSLIHTDPDEYNKIVRDGFFSRSRLDRGHLSEPLMLMGALFEWRACQVYILSYVEILTHLVYGLGNLTIV
jgi:HrpA-like RNA helicase